MPECYIRGNTVKYLRVPDEVKSVLDPCEDENDDIQDDDVSLGADSVQRECSEFDSEVGLSEDDQYIVAPIGFIGYPMRSPPHEAPNQQPKPLVDLPLPPAPKESSWDFFNPFDVYDSGYLMILIGNMGMGQLPVVQIQMK
ncbi:Meiosis-specific protein ASY1 [Camellia lanceoleosa]|uniref:Meiosis-specific protein ASY1 n=1 Tax=Camellia lanceoleosa TaxID=1840588 RepID=A0ACC0HDB5_9ERIC|nr:Meiosis-specific protein ASY1 [Camellia lanceoleosa]